MSLSSGAAAVLPAYTAAEGAIAQAEPIIVAQPKDIRSENYEPLTDSKNVERFLKDYFADMPIMAKIAKCESRNRHFDKSGQVLRGEKTPLDRGVMQINLHYHEATAEKLGYDLHNIDDNVAFARYLYEKYGAKPWMSSSKCWTKTASPAELAKI